MADLLRIADLNPKRVTRFDLTPDGPALTKIAADLDLKTLRKAKITGELKARGKRDWELTARIGATAVQECVITLAPVITRIDEDVHRIYLAQWDEPEENEVEMLMDEEFDPLPEALDLLDLLSEAISLSLPAFPRAEGAELSETIVTEVGVDPLTDAALKPFAGLADLKKKLES